MQKIVVCMNGNDMLFPYQVEDYIDNVYGGVSPYSLDRDDKRLVEAVEKYPNVYLYRVIEIPDGVQWEVIYDPLDGLFSAKGREYVAEKHRSWF